MTQMGNPVAPGLRKYAGTSFGLIFSPHLEGQHERDERRQRHRGEREELALAVGAEEPQTDPQE